ncbi:hypothetical protein BC828DRAFT_405896 [Blastocladiella britannica]|nr:hypothetical protein BC828DRAFT_405896 [Blastocladiella britannica]
MPQLIPTTIPPKPKATTARSTTPPMVATTATEPKGGRPYSSIDQLHLSLATVSPRAIPSAPTSTSSASASPVPSPLPSPLMAAHPTSLMSPSVPPLMVRSVSMPVPIVLPTTAATPFLMAATDMVTVPATLPRFGGFGGNGGNGSGSSGGSSSSSGSGSGSGGIAIPEAGPVLGSPDGKDPYRYGVLFEDRTSVASSAVVLHSSALLPARPLPPMPPAISTLPVTTVQQQPPRPASRAMAPLPPLPSPSSPLQRQSPAISGLASTPRRRSSLLRIGRVLRQPSSSSVLSTSSTSSLTSSSSSPSSSDSEDELMFVRNRRPSTAPVAGISAASKFVGSYEESLLSGRLSMRASRPIAFDVSIGVIGLGKCKPKLRCPPHASAMFAAHYYDLSAADKDILTLASSSPQSPPSPTRSVFGGNSPPAPLHADLDASSSSEWFASPPRPASPLRSVGGAALYISTSTSTSSATSPPSPSMGPSWSPYVGVINLDELPAPGSTKTNGSGSDMDITTPTAPPPPRFNSEGVVGGYEIPARGQLQIMIKNPNRTAIKVFLVPYDLSTVPPSHRTFIRHKQHAVPNPDKTSGGSSGAAVDGVPVPKSAGAVASHAVASAFPARALRYALHIPIVCTPRGRYFLAGHGGLRVVFSGKSVESYEKLVASTEPPLAPTPWVPTIKAKRPALVKSNKARQSSTAAAELVSPINR